MLIVPTSNSLAQTKTAQFIAHSKSIYLGSVQATFNDIGKIELFFTTVDGSSSKFPLYQQTSDGIIFSGEARPVSSNSSSFETDYAMYSYVLGEWIEFGRAVFKLPSTDSDNNGLLDILQYNKSGNFTTSGTGYVHAPDSETTKLTGTFTRSKNNDVGNYSVYIASTKRTLRGQWEIVYASGNVSYTRGSPSILDIDFRVDDSSGITVKFKANSQFTVRSQNEIVLPSLTATSDQNITYKVEHQIVFKRTGNRYQATVKLVDGMPQTSWGDYLGAVFEIVDTNDTDKDGVPDLSDNLAQPPAITSQPKSQEAKVGGSVVFNVVANGTPPLSYQWRKNGNNIPGAKQSSYSISNLRQSHFAEYSVVVSNSAGSVTSDNAVLTQIIESLPISIVMQPDSAIAAIGENVSFKVSAIGSGTLRYQWKKNGQNIAGATLEHYTINNIKESHFGSYSVHVYNDNSSATSDTVTLTKKTVSSPPKFLSQPKSQELEKGVNVLLSAEVEGSSPIFYQWVKDEQNIPGATLNTYTINNFQARHVGSYYLIARNAAGESISATAEITLLADAIIELTGIELIGEKTIRINYQISPEADYAIEASTDLIAWEPIFESTSSGLAEFFVTSVRGDSGKRFYRLDVKGEPAAPPIIVEQPSNKIVVVGETAIIRAKVESETSVKYQWYKNNIKIESATATELIIDNVNFSDAASYNLVVSNEGGLVVSDTAKLTVEEQGKTPIITQQPIPLMLMRNQSATLSVEVTGTKPFEYQWYKNGNEINGATQSIYQILNASPVKHVGFYKVKVTNKYGSVFSEEVLVTVE